MGLVSSSAKPHATNPPACGFFLRPFREGGESRDAEAAKVAGKRAPKQDAVSERGLFERHRADVLALAGGAGVALPEVVEVVEDAVDEGGGFGPNAHLEVAPPVGLGAEA